MILWTTERFSPTIPELFASYIKKNLNCCWLLLPQLPFHAIGVFICPVLVLLVFFGEILYHIMWVYFMFDLTNFYSTFLSSTPSLHAPHTTRLKEILQNNKGAWNVPQAWQNVDKKAKLKKGECNSFLYFSHTWFFYAGCGWWLDRW